MFVTMTIAITIIMIISIMICISIGIFLMRDMSLDDGLGIVVHGRVELVSNADDFFADCCGSRYLHFSVCPLHF